MHINFKYFIVSIGSIFIALGIGILIGSSLGTNESIQKQNASIIKDIDSKVNALKAVNDELTIENKQVQKNIDDFKTYLSNNNQVLIKSKLLNRRIGIISFDEDSTSNLVSDVITSTGGEVSFYITIKNSINQEDALQKINEKLDKKLEKKEDLETLIVDSIKVSNTDGRLSVLQDLGYIKINGFINIFDNVTNLIVNNTMDAKNVKVEEFQGGFIRKIKSLKPTIVAQKSSSEVDMAKTFSKYRISTLSNADEQWSYINLVTLINEKDLIGNFGKIDDNSSLLAISK
ncbi:copper transporter [Peptostreptococcus sp. D1]|uniref:copper transporter n=1 Tax=Peptostreptococcus sp. D1 TaxID=72304 RepID=UPI0008EF1C8B|nr:copper transporter [Peptostreptococcus sp. D1]SFE74156.1 Copper transport outer membrane protein, MctB [Peptostreptococcus sp. D1]